MNAVESTKVSPAQVIGSSYGGHSMTARLRTVMVRPPAPTVGGDEWRSFGYVHAIDHAAAQREHAAFTQMLSDLGSDVVASLPDPTGHLDAMFCYDPSLMTDKGAVLLRPGKELRRDEPALHAQSYAQLGIPILGAVEAPGTVEGGDTLWLDDTTLAVGRGYRTNADGIRQLSLILAEVGVTVVPYDLPHWHGAAECLHLMSLISPVAADMAVVFQPMMAVAFVEDLRDRGWRLIDIPEEEFETMGTNVLAIEPGKCVAVNRNPETRRRLEAAGCEVHVYVGDQISHNRQGGPTCLTRPIWRQR